MLITLMNVKLVLINQRSTKSNFREEKNYTGKLRIESCPQYFNAAKS